MDRKNIIQKVFRFIFIKIPGLILSFGYHAVIKEIPILRGIVDFFIQKKIVTLEEQKKYFQNQTNKYSKYIKCIQKVMIENFVNSTDTLFDSVTKKRTLVQVLVYSYPPANIKKEGTAPNRKYPKFLSNIGFIRVGGTKGNVFIIDKKKLNDRIK